MSNRQAVLADRDDASQTDPDEHRQDERRDHDAADERRDWPQLGISDRQQSDTDEDHDRDHELAVAREWAEIDQDRARIRR